MPKVDTVTFLPCDFWKELAYFDVYLVHPEQPASPPDSQCLSPGTPLQRLQDLRS